MLVGHIQVLPFILVLLSHECHPPHFSEGSKLHKPYQLGTSFSALFSITLSYSLTSNSFWHAGRYIWLWSSLSQLDRPGISASDPGHGSDGTASGPERRTCRIGTLEAAVHYVKSNSPKPSVALLISEMTCLWGMSSGFPSLEEKARMDPSTGVVYLGHLCMESVQAL